MAKVAYDDYYQTENYFGAPYFGLQDFFKNYPNKGHVLDLGCGQGRDALFISRQGFKVTGIDISSVGITQMTAAALHDNLDVTGYVADLYNFPISETYDIVLMDSILHLYQKDRQKESALVERIAKELKLGGLFVNFMQAGKTREQILKSLLSECCVYKVLFDDYTDYIHDNFQATYHRLIIQKEGD